MACLVSFPWLWNRPFGGLGRRACAVDPDGPCRPEQDGLLAILPICPIEAGVACPLIQSGLMKALAFMTPIFLAWVSVVRPMVECRRIGRIGSTSPAWYSLGYEALRRATRLNLTCKNSYYRDIRITRNNVRFFKFGFGA